ncbi:WD40-repeat-containing domain protein, partial [Baffinella frigidus]
MSQAEEQLSDSNRRIEELGEKRRVAAAECALSKLGVGHGGGTDKDSGRFRSRPRQIARFGAEFDLSRGGYAQQAGAAQGGEVAEVERRAARAAPFSGEVVVEELRNVHHDSFVWCCALHPVVPMLATGCGDGNVRLWRLDGECLRVLRGHREWVYCLAFDSFGDTLCSGSYDSSLRVWRVATGECVAVIRRAGCCFNAVAFQPGSSDHIAAASSDPAIRIFRITTASVVRTLL